MRDCYYKRAEFVPKEPINLSYPNKGMTTPMAAWAQAWLMDKMNFEGGFWFKPFVNCVPELCKKSKKLIEHTLAG
jgi:hypothetical protein